MANATDFKVKRGLVVSTTATILSTVNATSTTTGGLIVSGGAGIAKDLFVAGTISAVNTASALVVKSNISMVSPDAASTITIRMLNSDAISFSGNSGQLFSITDSMTGTIFAVNDISGVPSIEVYDTGEVRLAETFGYVRIPNATSATSTATGALRVDGGVGIGGDLYVGRTVSATTITATAIIGNLTGTVTTATNLAGGATGSIPYQTAAGRTSFIGIGSIGQILQSNGTTATWVSTGSLIAGTAFTATAILNGTAGQILYQSAPGVTAFAGPGTAGQILVSAGTAAPVYTNTGSIYVGNATRVDTSAQPANATYYPTFVDANNASAASEVVHTTSSFTINPATGNIGIGTSSPGTKLQVEGSVRFATNGSGANYLEFQRTTTNAWKFTSDGIGDIFTVVGNGITFLQDTTIQRGGLTVSPTLATAQNAINITQTWNNAATVFTLLKGNVTDTTSSATSLLMDLQTGGISRAKISKGGELSLTSNYNGNVVTLTATDRSVQFGTNMAADGFGIRGSLELTRDNGVIRFYNNNGTVLYGIVGADDGAANTLAQRNGVNAQTFRVYNTYTNASNYERAKIGWNSNVLEIGSENLGTGSLRNINLIGGNVGINTSTPLGYLWAPNGTDNAQARLGQIILNSSNVGGYTGSIIWANWNPLISTKNVAGWSYGIDLGRNGDYFSIGYIPTGSTTISDRLRIDSLGNLGIGTSTPASKLHVAGDARITGITTVSNTTAVSSTITGAFQVAGGVGIGGGLVVGGIVTATTFVGSFNGTVSTATSILTSAQTANATYYPTFVDANNATAAAELVHTTSSFVINPSTGNVGIGAASPSGILDVRSASTTSINSYLLNTVAYGAGGVQASVFNLGKVENGTVQVMGSVSAFPSGAGNSSEGTLTFSTRAGSVVSERVRIDNVGKVGIGTVSPTSLLHVAGDTRITGITTVTNNTAASSTITGAFQVVGGAGIGGNVYIGGNEFVAGTLQVNSTNANTGTNTSNAFYTAGGAWIEKTLVVGGDTTFKGSVVFQGTNTFVYSSSTVYTDNLISLHAPVGSGPGSHTWTVDDGKDIGFMFHYYKGADRDAFLGFDNDTQFLEWFSNGVESGGVFTGTTYGTFRTGGIRLVGGESNSGNTTTGSLQVLGGVGISGGVFVSGTVTATSFVGSFNGSIVGAATQVNTVQQTANATYYPTFVDSNNVSAGGESVFTTSSFSINPSTGLVNYSTGGILVGDTANTVSLQSDYSFPLIIQRSGNSNKGALLLRGSDTIGTAIEFGRSNAASHWGTYFSFYVHDDNTSDPLLSIKEKMRINATGVGIGNTTPLYKLHVNTAATVGTAASVLSNSTPILYLDSGAAANGSIVIKSHSVGNGNVHGAVKFASSPDSTNYSWSGIAGVADANGAASNLVFYTATGNAQATSAGASTERMRLDINGNLGIGATPASRLHIEGASVATNIIATSGNGIIRLGSSVSGANRKEFTTILDTTNNRVDLQAVWQGITTLPITINAGGGNVGIGLTAPASLLHVAGDARITGITTVTNTTVATSTITGAFQVVGGAGIGGALFVGGQVNITSGVVSTNTGTGALVVNGGVGINGALNAITKSFNIGHPTKPGMTLRYGSLEGPEFGVYVRGRLKGSNTIELPEYWTKLVDPDSITVNLTPVGSHQKLYVEDIVDNTIIVGNENIFGKAVDCFYTVWAERADIDKLQVESE